MILMILASLAALVGAFTASRAAISRCADQSSRKDGRALGQTGERQRRPTICAPMQRIYLKAGEWMLRHPEEFYKPEYSDQLLAVLDRGLARATELESGSPSWPKQKGRLSRAYRSRVDGSLQPYGLAHPGKLRSGKANRLDVVLHGRAAQMTESSFLFAHDSSKPLPADQQHIVAGGIRPNQQCLSLGGRDRCLRSTGIRAEALQHRP